MKLLTLTITIAILSGCAQGQRHGLGQTGPAMNGSAYNETSGNTDYMNSGEYKAIKGSERRAANNGLSTQKANETKLRTEETMDDALVKWIPTLLTAGGIAALLIIKKKNRDIKACLTAIAKSNMELTQAKNEIENIKKALETERKAYKSHESANNGNAKRIQSIEDKLKQMEHTLNHETEKQKEQLAEKLRKGERLYLAMKAGENISKWGNKEYEQITAYYCTIRNVRFKDRIHQHFNTLTYRNWIVLILGEEGKSAKEISGMLNLSPGAIRSMICYLRKKDTTTECAANTDMPGNHPAGQHI